MIELKRIKVLSLANIYALAILVVMGTLTVLTFFINLPFDPIDAFFTSFVMIFLTALYGAFGFLSGALTAWLYNIIAGWIGGVKIELKKSKR